MLDKPIKISGPTKWKLKDFQASERCTTYDEAIRKLLDGWQELKELKKECEA